MKASPSDVACIFVIDGLVMQAQGLLLASSLRRHASRDLRIFAYVPRNDRPPLDPAIRAAFQILDVKLVEMEADPAIWKKPFPHGNKILAACQPRSVAGTAFLDSDMIVVDAIDIASLIVPKEIAAVPEGKPTWGKGNDRWERVYSHFGFPLPQERVRLTRGRKRLFVPYFNAGLVAWPEGGADGFPAIWKDTAIRIDHEVAVAMKRPWLDQVALPVAARRAGLAVRVLGEEWNYAISDRRDPGAGRALILHYHRFQHAKVSPAFADAFRNLEDQLGRNLPRDVRVILSAGLPEASDV